MTRAPRVHARPRDTSAAACPPGTPGCAARRACAPACSYQPRRQPPPHWQQPPPGCSQAPPFPGRRSRSTQQAARGHAHRKAVRVQLRRARCTARQGKRSAHLATAERARARARERARACRDGVREVEAAHGGGPSRSGRFGIRVSPYSPHAVRPALARGKSDLNIWKIDGKQDVRLRSMRLLTAAMLPLLTRNSSPHPLQSTFLSPPVPCVP